MCQSNTHLHLLYGLPQLVMRKPTFGKGQIKENLPQVTQKFQDAYDLEVAIVFDQKKKNMI